MVNKLRKYAKAVLAEVGGLTPGLVVGVLALFHVDIDATTAATVVAVASPILAAIGIAAGPANKPPAPKELTEAPRELLSSWLDA
ncbi:hypothetical protein [Amycolatopsis sp. NPDC051372]|uniref:hypothetical protein n=1 Tax=Amycolatopsis sp. NPDC051372 TaxID=3155669 RepID=UPI0034208007